MRRAVWAAAILLAALAVTSAIVRAVAIVRPQAALVAVQREAALSLNSDEWLVRQFEARFAARPLMTLLHVVPGGLFLALGLLQFSPRIRRRAIGFHRWSGRVLMVALLISSVAGIYFGVLIPLAGFGEASVIGLVGAWTGTAVVRGYLSIRRGDVERHRRWMIRAFAAALAVGTVRVVGAVIQMVAPMPPVQEIVVSFWGGWLLTLGAAEAWIISTSARTYSSTARGIGSATR